MSLQDFRCASCNRLLGKISLDSMVEIKCPKCKYVSLYDPAAGLTNIRLGEQWVAWRSGLFGEVTKIDGEEK